jgi:hypothetical protein
MANSYLHVGNLIPLTGASLEANDASPGYRKGGITIVNDDYGIRIFQYNRNQSGSAQGQGELAKKVADVTVANVTSGSTTGFVKASSLTADIHVGRILYVDDNDDSAGAAPEGESAPIVSNTAGAAVTDSDYPFSAALAANDDVRSFTPGWHVTDAADGDLAKECAGVVVAASGISDSYYGWYQNYGFNPAVKFEAGAVTSNNPVVAAAASVGAHGSDTAELWVGFAKGTVAADQVRTLSPAFLLLFGGVRPLA